jgi:phosphonate transport system ATP-binding protein
MALFQFDRASLGYNGRAVVRNLSLSIRAGERVALVGASGAGKSTVIAALYAQQKALTALVPQDGALVKQLSVYHNVYIGRLHRHSGAYNLVNLLRPIHRHVAEVEAILTTLGLAEKLFTAVGELSGGQQQRTAVARALYHGGEVLLGDEPVSAVDGLQSRAVLEAINAAYPTVVLAMHDVALAIEYTGRIIGLKSGEVVLDVPSAGLTPADLTSLYR